jgi:hypothetical protein
MQPEETSQPNTNPNPERPPVPDTTAPAVESTTTPSAPETVTPTSPATPVTPAETPAAPAEPAQPAVSTPVVNGSAAVPPASSNKKRWLLPAIIAGVVILLAAVYVFAFYLPNTPANVYSASLKNSGKAVDKLIEYVQEQDTAKQQGVTFDGTLKSSGGSTNFDASLNGSFDKNANGTLAVKADVSGEHMTVDVRSVKESGNKTPDVYLQVQGMQQLLAAYGLGDLDGKWVSIDHTLIDSYVSQAKQMADSTAGSDVATATLSPTVDQINDAISKVQTVNRQYLFTDDSSKAVLTKQQFVGKETHNNRPVNHYKVGINKDHLQAYVAALKTALDSSKLNDWSKKANDGKSLSEVMNWNELEKEVKSANPSTFDLWTDNKTKLVSAIQFTDTSDGVKATIAQNYTGGDVYPFSISMTNPKDKTENVTFGVTVDTKANKYTMTVDTPTNDNDGKLSFKLNMALSDKPVKVSAPSGATSINDVLGGLFGGSSFNDSELNNSSLDSLQTGASNSFDSSFLTQ